MLKNISPDSISPVRQDLSGKLGCPVLSGHETHMPSLGEPYLGPFVTVLVSMTTPSFANIFAVNYVLWSTKLLGDHLWEKLEIIF